MTLIEFFTSAYLTKDGFNTTKVKHIIRNQSAAFFRAKEEYNYLKDNYGSDFIIEFINSNIIFGKQEFKNTYKPTIERLKL